MSRIIDNAYAFKFAALLQNDWVKWDAFKLGLIDGEGTTIKSAETPPELKAWTYMHRLAANIKRITSNVPGGKSILGRAITQYALFRESFEGDQADVDQYLVENYPDHIYNLAEQNEYLEEVNIKCSLSDYIKLDSV